MKILKNILYGTLLISLSSTGISCNKLVEGLNKDPNLPSETSSDLLLTGLQVGSATLHGGGEITRDAGLWSGYFVGLDRQYFGFYNYLILNSDFNTHWANTYRVIRNTVVLEETIAQEKRSGIISGINKVLKAHTFGMATALWGDIPFKEAGKFVEYGHPHYDDQKAIYEGVQILLDEAIEDLKQPIGRPVSGADIFFNGDAAAWTRVANSLKARFYLHTKNYGKALQFASLGIQNKDQAWNAKFTEASGAQNLYYQLFNGNRSNDIQTNGNRFFDLISPTSSEYRGNAKTNETARYKYLLRERNPGQFANNTTVNGAFGITKPYAIMSFEEVQLILAEATLRENGFSAGLKVLNDLRAYYRTKKHIGDAFLSEPAQYDDYVLADFEVGGMLNSGSLTTEKALLKEILEEKFIVLYAHLESFNDFRRTFDEGVGVGIKPNVDTKFPQRFIYPQTEIDRNINKPKTIPNIYERTTINK